MRIGIGIAIVIGIGIGIGIWIGKGIEIGIGIGKGMGIEASLALAGNLVRWRFGRFPGKLQGGGSPLCKNVHWTTAQCRIAMAAENREIRMTT